MKEKQTKESLLVANTKLDQANEYLTAEDIRLRKEFARAFGWNKAKKLYDYGESELYQPTWIEIFVELGKLLNARNFTDFEGNVSEIECRLENVVSAIKKDINPNFNA